MRKHRTLTHHDRYSIEKLLLANEKVSDIANILGFHRSSIYREISRNKDYYGNYVHYIAEKKSINRVSKRGRKSLLDKDLSLSSIVSDLLTINKFSPEQVSNYLKKLTIKTLSFMSIYRYIAKDKKNGGDLYKRVRRLRNKRFSSTKESYNTIKGKKHISERPSIVDNKTRFGDWELDTLEVSRGSEYLITLVERKSKYLITQKTTSKDSTIVADLIIEALKPIKDKVKTITTDNGIEFSKFRRIEYELDTSIYFTDTYASWQKGLNENTNGLIRYFIPKKGKNRVSHISYKKLEKIEHLINNRPRKTLKYRTPNEVFMKVKNLCVIDYTNYKKVSQ